MTTKEKLGYIALVVLGVAIMLVGAVLHYQVMKERFPSAPTWTHFFK